ncbi:MAG: hypothetical protein A3G32_01475 [Deltaproteobacteria bacterium RIFCSPLOWO2_12_FULL_40_28]|nr:MAG: hypothetical protein A3C45_06220 [Deltaproteobacteria bacterium RIFCSPHIGHO2_02_FULL_40_28]OGQ18804.1 MAG: hypothetical protein A3E27_08855 [Deltaproteobacteria bacterium RIFCSPHIGHO2_12_FULL_40_32]OGQ40049.1 MAG: hypothetical protein A3I69_01385 [Deltaproteobacteria bacterium RIFCSPLOWO2_02_FULL_40_36]OGQ53232.1 MAG: hypothetical protein A3G32_01475 [Deltaproteobacteria bacterium RIFCSPLOWO2_12_FULL_40_28]
MKSFKIIFLLGFLILLSSSLLAEEKIRKGLFLSQFHVELEPKDKITITFTDDGMITGIPSIYNKVYTHNCTGHWAFHKRNQDISINRFKGCEPLEGRYRVKVNSTGLGLRDGFKTVFLKFLNR